MPTSKCRRGSRMRLACMQVQTKGWVRFLLSMNVPKNKEFKLGEFVGMASIAASEFPEAACYPYPTRALEFLQDKGLYKANGKRGFAATWKRIGDANPESVIPSSQPRPPEPELAPEVVDWHPEWAKRLEEKPDRIEESVTFALDKMGVFK